MQLALQEGGLSYIKLQHFILTLRNRTIHKCDLTDACDALEINIGLISLRDDGNKRVQHYPTPYLDCEEKYKIGLANSH